MTFRYLILTLFTITVFSFSAFGEDRALLIGIDTYQFASKTPGSVADAESMARFIQGKYNFPLSSIKLLTNKDATARNIKSSIQNWLIDGTKPGDRVFLLYSGHGAQVDDDNGDESDQLDEIIAPYDVFPGDETNPPSNFIRDDEMNIFLAKLAGRRVVFLFDSCNSGTISRGDLQVSDSKFLAVKNKYTSTTSRSIGDTNSYVPKDPNSKDMYVVKEEIVDGKLDGVVIFSAAKAYQKANWLRDQSRSVFSYAFEMVQQDNDFPSVNELNTRIGNYVQKLRIDGLAVTSQVPEVEVISRSGFENKPLFGNANNSVGSWEESVLPSINNPTADFKVGISLNGRTFRIGDKLTYSVEISGLKTGEKAYLYILDFARDDSGDKYVVSLFPTVIGNDSDNYLGNGKHSFPRKGKNDQEYETVAETKGKDVLVALVSKVKLNFGTKDKYGWDEAYSLIGVNKISEQIDQLSRSLGNRVKLQGGDWQATSVVIRVQ